MPILTTIGLLVKEEILIFFFLLHLVNYVMDNE